MLMNQISPARCLRQQTNEFRDSDFHQEVAKESDCHQLVRLEARSVKNFVKKMIKAISNFQLFWQACHRE